MIHRILFALVLSTLILTSTSHAEEPVTRTLLAAAENAEEVEGADPNGILLVMWSAHWCNPCKIDEPFIRAFAKKEGWTFIYINTDNERTRSLRNKFEIKGMPTYHVFSNGALVERVNFDRYKTDGSDAEVRVNTRFTQTKRKLPKP